MTSIETAAYQKTVLKAALAYVESGCSILPVQGKRPALITINGAKTRFPWTSLQNQRPQPFHVEQWHKKGWLHGIGLICGSVSGNLVVIDLDGKAAVEQFRATWNNLYQATYRVRSGSGQGMHVYVYVDNMPPSVRTKGFELRGDGCYVVAPPSRHPDTGNLYEAVNGTAVIQLPDLNNLVDWIQHINRRERKQNAPPTPQSAPLPASVRGSYGNRALEGEIGKVRSASKGTRNNQLNLSAFRLGQLIAGGHLQQVDVEIALYQAATARGLSHHEAQRTIASGVHAGIQSPRFSQ